MIYYIVYKTVVICILLICINYIVYTYWEIVMETELLMWGMLKYNV